MVVILNIDNYFQPMASMFQYIYTQCIYLTCLAYAGVLCQFCYYNSLPIS